MLGGTGTQALVIARTQQNGLSFGSAAICRLHVAYRQFAHRLQEKVLMSPPQIPSGPFGQEQRISSGPIIPDAQTPDVSLSMALDHVAFLVRRYWLCVLA